MLPAVDSRVFKIVGGNALLPERLLAASGATVKSSWVVDTVRPGRRALNPKTYMSLDEPNPGSLFYVPCSTSISTACALSIKIEL